MSYGFIAGGSHTCQVPAVVNGVSAAGVTWSASDPSMVVFDPMGGLEMITMQKAGTVDVIAKAGDQCGVSKLTITEFTEDDWAAGNARYNNKIPLPPLLPPD